MWSFLHKPMYFMFILIDLSKGMRGQCIERERFIFFIRFLLGFLLFPSFCFGDAYALCMPWSPAMYLIN